MFGFKKDKDDDRELAPLEKGQKLTALVRGIQHAVSSTQTMVSQHYMQLLGQFFDEQDGQLRAKMVYVKLNERYWVPVPLISLVSPHNLQLDRMRIKLAVAISEAEARAATIDEDNAEVDRLSFNVVVSPRSKGGQDEDGRLTTIEMEFKAGDPPESISRLVELYTNAIEPKDGDEYGIPEDLPGTSIRYSNMMKKKS